MIVVTRLLKKDGPPNTARQPRRAGFLFFRFLDFLAGVFAMLRSILFGMILVEYKKASIKFAPVETFSAGLELTGGEVKTLRSKRGSLDGSRVLIRGGEAYLVGMTIPPYQAANSPESYDPERPRRLLLTREEIAHLAAEEAKKGLTIVPLEVYTAGRFLKVKIAIVRGKGKADRREDIKKRDALREAARDLKR